MDTENIYEKIIKEIHKSIDVQSGVWQTFPYRETEYFCEAAIKWRGNLELIFMIRRGYGRAHVSYYVQRNGEQVSLTYYGLRQEDYKWVQKLVNAIENGDYNYKKTISDRVAEEIQRRGLTSYMNQTKWREFLHAMDSEMSVALPYDYKTLFDAQREEDWFGYAYDIESFNGYYFKSLEWVKVRTKFSDYKNRGRLLDPEEIKYDKTEEFLSLMNKYHIPYEYNEEKQEYIIYGYK